MGIYAISDLHLANVINQKALLNIPLHRGDWLILAGDIGETEDHLKFALTILTSKFEKIIWVPGNHDLWTFPLNGNSFRGEDKYNKLVEICKSFGVHTPEDEYLTYQSDNGEYCLVPMFTLYDYSFIGNDVEKGKEIEWAAESGVICADEDLLFTDPYNSIKEWCKIRCDYTDGRLSLIPAEKQIIAINHYPLLKTLGKIYTFPRFSIWCGTTRTESWLEKYNIEIVVYGHLHIRSSKLLNGVKHEEVSLGYPNDWNQEKGIEAYLKKII